MTQRVTDEQARYVEGGLVFPGSVPTSIDLAADLLDARAEIEQLRATVELLEGEVKAAETRSGMANVIEQYEAQLKAQRARPVGGEMTWHKKLVKMDACIEAVEWAKPYKTFTAAWNDCERGDWMLWLAGRSGVDRKIVVFAACQCARLALKYVTKGEGRPLRCIETTEAWTRGEATLEEVLAARQGTNASAASYAASAADAAAYAAYAAEAASDAASAASDAADASAAASYAASDAADATRTKTLRKCAVIVRKTITPRMIRWGEGKP
jgi:hypothetical protein